MDAVLSINATFGKSAADRETTLEAKVRASMKAVLRENWMETNDDALFRAGIGGAMLSVEKDSDDYRQMESSVNVLRKFSAFLAAAQAGLSVDFPDLVPDDAPQPLPLIKWWNEAKAPLVSPEKQEER